MPGDDDVHVARVIDAGLPAEARRRLERKISRSAGNPAGRAGCLAIAVAVVWLIVSAIVHSAGGLAWWWVAASALPALGAFASFRLSAAYALDHRDYQHFVRPSDLDDMCRGLLHRAQQAINAILHSDVYANESLEYIVIEPDLRRHEWEIATALREITKRRAEHERNAEAEAAGPVTAAVLDSHRRAIMLAQDATTSRVAALEGYAAQLKAADGAKRDLLNAVKVSRYNDRYLDLVARTAADEKAIEELTGMTEQAAAAAAAFRESLQQVSSAAEALVLPAIPTGTEGSG